MSAARVRLGFACLLGALVAASCSRGGPSSIDSGELRAHVASLASDEMAGRLTGSPQIARAEEYIAEAFERSGLEHLPGLPGWFLDYTAWKAGYDRRATSLSVTHQGAAVATAELGTDFRPFAFSSTGQVAAGVVFAGYGITAPEYGWDDYRGLDVRGKLVLLLRYEPNENDPSSPFAGTRHTTHATFATKARNARAHGAAGMLLFTTPLGHGPDEDLRVDEDWRLDPEELAGSGPSNPDGSFLALQLSQGFADRVARAAGSTIRDLQAAVDRGVSPTELGVDGLAAAASVARPGEPEPVRARDVVGYIPGRTAGAVVVVGAHHDHIGAFPAAGDGDTVYNGADDNASGVAAVLELAQAFGRRRQRPERGIVFVTFSGEEQYLLGSAALLESGLLPPERIAFMLNMDMVGRNPGGELQAIGASSDPELRSAVERANADLRLRLAFPTGLAEELDSDQSSFGRLGVPSVFLHAGLHDDYHGLDDEADRLDYPRLELVALLAFRLIDDQASPGGKPARAPAPATD